MKKAIALILVIGILVAGVLYLRKIEHTDQESMRDLYTVLEPLQRQRESLVQELDQLETDYAIKMRDVGTVELLFRELDKELFTDIYPLMRDRGITGVLCLSQEEFPGYPAKLSAEQYNRLLMDGWGSCFNYDKKAGDFQTWYNRLAFLLARDNLPVPTAVYFSDDSYDSSLDETLLACGIDTVILNAADGHSAIVNPVNGSSLWFTGAMPWNYTGMSRDTEILARTSGANLVFTISFNSLWDAYEKDSFLQVINNWASLLVEDDILQSLIEPTPAPSNQESSLTETQEDPLTKPQLRVMDLASARSAHEEAELQNKALEKELADRRSMLEKQIAELDEQIRIFYDQWGQSGKQTALPPEA